MRFSAPSLATAFCTLALGMAAGGQPARAEAPKSAVRNAASDASDASDASRAAAQRSIAVAKPPAAPVHRSAAGPSRPVAPARGVAPPFAAPPRSASQRGEPLRPGLNPGVHAARSRVPTAAAGGMQSVRRIGGIAAGHPGVLGGPARYGGKQAGVLNGTGLKRRPGGAP